MLVTVHCFVFIDKSKENLLASGTRALYTTAHLGSLGQTQECSAPSPGGTRYSIHYSIPSGIQRDNL